MWILNLLAISSFQSSFLLLDTKLWFCFSISTTEEINPFFYVLGQVQMLNFLCAKWDSTLWFSAYCKMEYYLLTFELWGQGPNYCTTLSCSFFSSGANMITSFCHFSMQLILLSCKCKLPCHMAFRWKWRRVYKLCRHERLHVGLHY